MSVSVESYRTWFSNIPLSMLWYSFIHRSKALSFFQKQKTSSCVCVLQVLSPQPGTCFPVVHYYSSSDPTLLSPWQSAADFSICISLPGFYNLCSSTLAFMSLHVGVCFCLSDLKDEELREEEHKVPIIFIFLGLIYLLECSIVLRKVLFILWTSVSFSVKWS